MTNRTINRPCLLAEMDPFQRFSLVVEAFLASLAPLAVDFCGAGRSHSVVHVP